MRARALIRAVVTGGGSAGHVVPTLPVIEALQARDWNISYIGSDSGLEERLVAPLGVDYFGVRPGKLRRYWSFDNLVDAFRVPLSVLRVFGILGRIRPDVVFSKGGFVAFPVVVAAWFRRIPVVAHESDLSPGLANRLTLPLVASLCVNFDATRVNAKRVIHTGTPVRESLVRGDRARGLIATGFSGNRPILAVVGGSLGAERLNLAVREAVSALTREFDVLHVCGAGKVDPSYLDIAGYEQRDFIGDEWGDILAAADLVVSRSGANSLYELLTLRKPNLLVPLPASASRGDQIENAAYARSSGFSMVVTEADLTPEVLVERVTALHRDAPSWRERLDAFEVPDSAGLIVAELEAALKKRPKR